MVNNIFIKDIDINILYNFLDQYCIYENDHYIIDKLVFKKYDYYNKLYPFYSSLSEFYSKNKQYYLEREITYNNFLTIIRHICKYKDIQYYNKIKYDKNKYFITYYIKKENTVN